MPSALRVVAASSRSIAAMPAVAPRAPHIAGRKKRSLLRAALPIVVATSTATEQPRISSRPLTPPRASAQASSVASTTAIGCTTAGSCTQSHSWLWIW